MKQDHIENSRYVTMYSFREGLELMHIVCSQLNSLNSSQLGAPRKHPINQQLSELTCSQPYLVQIIFLKGIHLLILEEYSYCPCLRLQMSNTFKTFVQERDYSNGIFLCAQSLTLNLNGVLWHLISTNRQTLMPNQIMCQKIASLLP